jgi:uncharacterized iron-regulated membrane protein
VSIISEDTDHEQQASTVPAARPEPRIRSWPDYGAVWRWHFYAGILCIPFVIVLSITGTIYLFRPQIESWQERPFDRVPVETKQPMPYAAQVRAAVASVDGGTFAAVERASFASPSGETVAATRVMVDRNGERIRVYVDPVNNKVLGSVIENERFIRVVRRIHGELLLGKRGSYLVETVASWTIVMVLTGMVLWWPRKMTAAGVLYPRLLSRGKTFWKDMHSVVGFWASGLILFLVATGLPWSTFWGDYFKSVRRLTNTSVATQHWESGHEGHDGHEGHRGDNTSKKSMMTIATPRTAAKGPSWRSRVPDPSRYQLDEIERVTQFAATLRFDPPVIISPPSEANSVWTVKSETANRPHRQTIHFDAAANKTIRHETFADQHWVDQIVGQGIALHEGQRFGWLNQLIALFATMALVMLSCSGLVLWWRRRDVNGMAPPASKRLNKTTQNQLSKPRLTMLACVVLLLGAYLPLFGASLVIVLVLDWLVFSRFKPIAIWTGRLAPASILLILCLLLVAGCSDTVRPVSGGTPGRLTSGGKPMSQMQVNAFSVSDPSPIGRGYVASDGSFELVTNDSSEPLQLLPGTYHFTIESIGAEVIIPKEFSDPATTPLKISVANEQPIALELPHLKGMD